MTTKGKEASTPLWLSDGQGYPGRTFPIRILKTDPEESITFTEASSSQQAGPSREPLRRAKVEVSSAVTREALQLASEAIRASHIVSFPTETVYGLGANALSATAASKIFAAKGRPADNPLIVHVSDLEMLDQLLPPGYEPNRAYKALMKRFWPGALTLLMPVQAEEAAGHTRRGVPALVRCNLKTLGVRMPSHPLARALIAMCQVPLAAPSANTSGRPSPTRAEHVYRDMTRIDSTTTSEVGGEVQGRLPYILDGGPCELGVESTVVDGVTTKGELRVLRPGGISVEAIEEALEEEGLLAVGEGMGADEAVRVRVYGRDMARDKHEEANPTTPGMKYRHYSPDAQVILLVPFRPDQANGVTPAAGPTKDQARGTTAMALGESLARNAPAMPLKDAVTAHVERVFREGLGGQRRPKVGLMSMDNSPLTRSLEDPQLNRFSLGSVDDRHATAAKRLFDGLRRLDETEGCDLIFVEAMPDDLGLGLAVMNRLAKAASGTALVEV